MGTSPSSAALLTEMGENTIKCIPATGSISVTIAPDGSLLGTNPAVMLSTVPVNAALSDSAVLFAAVDRKPDFITSFRVNRIGGR